MLNLRWHAGDELSPFIRNNTANPGAAVRVLGQLRQPVQGAPAEPCQHAAAQWLVSLIAASSLLALVKLHVNGCQIHGEHDGFMCSAAPVCCAATAAQWSVSIDP